MRYRNRLKKSEDHIKTVHKQSLFAPYLKEMIYGGVDGVTTTFAVVAGFSGATLSSDMVVQLSSTVVLIFGFANLFADGISLGLGNFLSVRSDQSLYERTRQVEARHSRRHPDIEAEETKTLLMEQGFTTHDAQTLTVLYQKNEKYWISFLMDKELRFPDPSHDNAIRTSLVTSLSFVTFGLIPLMPFMIVDSMEPHLAFYVSIAATLSALALLGFLKGKVIGTKLYRSIFEVVLIGGLAALAAYGVGMIFGRL